MWNTHSLYGFFQSYAYVVTIPDAQEKENQKRKFWITLKKLNLKEGKC